MKSALFVCIAVALTACSPTDTTSRTNIAPTRVQVGADILIQRHLPELEGRKIGLVMNPTARVDGTHMLDTLRALDVTITALFAPEHGFRGDFGAGEKIADGIDESTGLPVYSLYGTNRKPTPAMLEGIDLLIYDMQDVGARFYTYISTLGLVLEAAAENNIEVWVLDRPNPAGGDYVSGWMLDPKHTSFVGAFPIPIAYGLTIGELANMMVGEEWLKDAAKPNYKVINMEGWNRGMKWPETGLPWVPPSPNLPTFESAWVYLGTCLVEGTTMSEGRGTELSFLQIGDPSAYVTKSTREDVQTRFGVQLQPVTFVPQDIPGRASNTKHKGMTVRGWKIDAMANPAFDPVAFGHVAVKAFLDAAPAASMNNFMYRLAGTDRIVDYLASEGLEDPATLWADEVAEFNAQRKPYLIY